LTVAEIAHFEWVPKSDAPGHTEESRNPMGVET